MSNEEIERIVFTAKKIIEIRKVPMESDSGNSVVALLLTLDTNLQISYRKGLCAREILGDCAEHIEILHSRIKKEYGDIFRKASTSLIGSDIDRQEALREIITIVGAIINAIPEIDKSTSDMNAAIHDLDFNFDERAVKHYKDMESENIKVESFRR